MSHSLIHIKQFNTLFNTNESLRHGFQAVEFPIFQDLDIFTLAAQAKKKK